MNLYKTILYTSGDLVVGARIVIKELPLKIVEIISCTRHFHPTVDSRCMLVENLMLTLFIMNVPIASEAVL